MVSRSYAAALVMKAPFSSTTFRLFGIIAGYFCSLLIHLSVFIPIARGIGGLAREIWVRTRSKETEPFVLLPLLQDHFPGCQNNSLPLIQGAPNFRQVG